MTRFTDCSEVREELSAYLDGELADDERQAVDAHVQDCAECRAELESMQQVDAAYGALGGVKAPDYFLEEAVGVAEGEAEAAADNVREFPRKPPVWMGPLVAVAAAGFIVAIGVFFLEREQDRRFQTASTESESAEALQVQAPATAPEAIRREAAAGDAGPSEPDTDPAWEGLVGGAQAPALRQRSVADAAEPEAAPDEATSESDATFESLVGRRAAEESLEKKSAADEDLSADRADVLGEPSAAAAVPETEGDEEEQLDLFDDEAQREIRESAPLSAVKLRSFSVRGDGVWYERGYDGEETTALARDSAMLRELMKDHPEDDWNQLLRRNARQVIQVGGAWYELLPPEAEDAP